MLLGVEVTSTMVIAGGATLAALLVFQVLLGFRKIKFKGKLHLQVHKAVAIAMLVAVPIHALAALALFDVISL